MFSHRLFPRFSQIIEVLFTCTTVHGDLSNEQNDQWPSIDLSILPNQFYSSRKRIKRIPSCYQWIKPESFVKPCIKRVMFSIFHLPLAVL